MYTPWLPRQIDKRLLCYYREYARWGEEGGSPWLPRQNVCCVIIGNMQDGGRKGGAAKNQSWTYIVGEGIFFSSQSVPFSSTIHANQKCPE